MTNTLNISIVQMNPTVGAITHNCAKIEAAYRKAVEVGADLVVTPELSIIGYPPEDLVLKPAFQREAQAAVERLAAVTKGANNAGLLVGCCWLEDGKLYNAVLLLEAGKIAAIRYKRQLPNYGVFDEVRLFSRPDKPSEPIVFRGVSLGVMICEDMWFPESAAHHKKAGADILIVPTSSPFEVDKRQNRLKHAKNRVLESGLPLVFANQLGGQDELVFDGSSFVMDENGAIVYHMDSWCETTGLTTWQRGENKRWSCLTQKDAPTTSDLAEIYQAMVLGLRDYIEKNRFPGVLIGLSGGIDSALSAAVAVDALGAERVRCVMMPSRYTADTSVTDANDCATALGVGYETIAIEPGIKAFDAMLENAFKDQPIDTTEENIQSRLRGMLLMSLSNKFGYMVLTTGNKSEISVGYATLYGDMSGGFNVLKDVYKTLVFQLSAWRNKNVPLFGKGPSGVVIPQNIIDKPPTAELRDNQKDEDSLPPYDALDDMLRCLVDEEMSAKDVILRGHSAEDVARIEQLLYIAEYKRRQAPPGVKITQRNFGRDRRYPITNGFRSAFKK